MGSSATSTTVVPSVGRELVPGQLWQWQFGVGDGWWASQKVTEAGRYMNDLGYETMKRGDVFTVVTLDDPGPYQLPQINGLNDIGQYVTQPKKLWHVVLFKDALIWMEHDHFEQAILLRDVE